MAGAVDLSAQGQRTVLPLAHVVQLAAAGVMFAGPFITIHGNPLLLMNIVERKFVVLGQIFWPQDMIIFAIAVLVFFTGIVIFTAAFGRLWCGWACPQTVMMEMVFRKIEYAHRRRRAPAARLEPAPWTAGKIARKFPSTPFFSRSRFSSATCC
jgi:polyferredoxin